MADSVGNSKHVHGEVPSRHGSTRFPTVEALPSVPTLPNPFEFVDGSLVETPEDWERRRNELSEAARHYVFGFVQKPQSLSYSVRSSENVELTISMTQDTSTASFAASVDVPRYGENTSIPGPYPVLITIGKTTDAQKTELLRQGYAVIDMPTGPVYSDDSGALMGWGWGVSRVIDGLEMGAFPDIDPTMTIVTGVSRNGKAALLASAFDSRIALTVPVDTGQAGASSFRYNVEGRLYHYVGNPFPNGMGRSEKISNMMGMFRHWFSSQIAEFTDNEDKLSPFVGDSAYIPWSRPGKHTLWTNQEQILAGRPTMVTAFSEAETVTLKPPSTWFSPSESITVDDTGESVWFSSGADTGLRVENREKR